jgi:DNA-binding MarR family transcriptional regulator
MYSMERTSESESGPGGPDLAALFSGLVRLETELWDLVEARLRRDHDLALSWFEPMQVIDATPGCRVIDIAETLAITIGGTSKLVDRIQNAGWCERSPHPDDGRSSTIRLTRAGQRLLAAAQRTFTDEVETLFGEPLSTSELQRFAATVHKLRAHVHEQRRSA